MVIYVSQQERGGVIHLIGNRSKAIPINRTDHRHRKKRETGRETTQPTQDVVRGKKVQFPGDVHRQRIIFWVQGKDLMLVMLTT